jgi:protocatechuate 3,4-dioxygenase beta subunit
MKRITKIGFLFAAVLLFFGGRSSAHDDDVTIISQPVLTAQIGHLYEYDVDAISNNPGDIIVYRLDEAPAGMTINDSTGLIRWIPGVAGAFRVKVRAEIFHDSPNDGGHGEQEYTLRVLAGSPSTLRGTVRNQQGGGIANVRVTMFEISSAHFLFSGRTDSTGRYSIPGINPGMYFLRASPSGNSIYAEQWYNGVRRIQDATPVTIPESATVAINFVLFPRDSSSVLPAISGTVRDSTGHPIASASVSIFAARQDDDIDGSGVNFEGLDDHDRDQRLVTVVSTDSLGRYSARLRSRKYILAARKDGFATQFWNHKTNPLDADRLRLVRDTTGIDFNLAHASETSGAIAGIITSRSSSAPLAAHVIGFHKQTPGGPFTGFVRHAQTDSLGRYTLRELRPGYYVVLALPHEEFLPTFYDTTGGTTDPALAFPVQVTTNTVGNINIRAFPDTISGMNRLKGTVSSLGIGVQGVILYAYAPTTNTIAGAAVSDANGVYKLVGLSPGSYSISAVKAGYVSTTSPALLLQYNGNLPTTLTENITITQSPTAVEDDNGQLPGRFALEQNYPNPFNPTTEIRYVLPQQSSVKVTIYNIIGQEVTRLFEGQQPSGSYVVTWNGTNKSGAAVSSGVYFYRLEALSPGASAFIQSRKMMLLK